MKFLTPIILLALSFGLFFWYINPTYSKVGVLQTKLTEYQTAITRAKQASAKRDDLVNRYNNFNSADIARLQKLLPDNIDNIRLIVDVNAIASKYTTGIKDIHISASNDPAAAVSLASNQGVYGTLTMGFNTSMSYEKFLLFIKDLEHSLRIIDVSGISFKPTATGTYDYAVTLKTYWLR